MTAKGKACREKAWGSRLHPAGRSLERSDALPDLVITDYRLNGEATGIEVIKRLRQTLGRELPAILLTGDTSPAWKLEAVALGCPILYKPIDSDILVVHVRQLVGADRRETRKVNKSQTARDNFT